MLISCFSTINCSFSLCKLISILWEDTLRLCKFPISPQTLIRFTIHWLFLAKLLQWMLPDGYSYNKIISFTFVSCHSTVKTTFSSPYLFIYLCQCGFMDYCLCNGLLSVIMLVLIWSSILSRGAPLNWPLCPFDTSPSSLIYFTLWHKKIFQTSLTFLML